VRKKFVLGLAFISPYEDEERGYIKMYFKNRTKRKRTHLDYTLRTMVAEIGGYTGLLLGVSIVHVTSLLDKFHLQPVRRFHFI